jgi:hypothetical protein
MLPLLITMFLIALTLQVIINGSHHKTIIVLTYCIMISQCFNWYIQEEKIQALKDRITEIEASK